MLYIWPKSLHKQKSCNLNLALVQVCERHNMKPGMLLISWFNMIYFLYPCIRLDNAKLSFCKSWGIIIHKSSSYTTGTRHSLAIVLCLGYYSSAEDAVYCIDKSSSKIITTSYEFWMVRLLLLLVSCDVVKLKYQEKQNSTHNIFLFRSFFFFFLQLSSSIIWTFHRIRLHRMKIEHPVLQKSIKNISNHLAKQQQQQQAIAHIKLVPTHMQSKDCWVVEMVLEAAAVVRHSMANRLSV